MLRIILSVILLNALVNGDTVGPSEITGNWVSRSCENTFGAVIGKRSYTFGADGNWSIQQNFYATSSCTNLVSTYSATGRYQLMGLVQLEFTEATAIDMLFDQKTFTPHTQDIANFYNQACGVSLFLVDQIVDVTTLNCPALALESPCPEGLRNIIASRTLEKFYNNALWLGESATCSTPRPSYLSAFGLTRPDASPLNPLAIPTTATHKKDVLSIIDNIDINNIYNVVNDLSSEYTRYFSTPGGVRAGQYFLDKYQTLQQCNENVEVVEFKNQDIEPKFNQSSVIARILGKDKSQSPYRIIVGGHIDSANFYDDEGNSTFTLTGEDIRWSTRPAPGADDDLSASAMILELFRVLLDAGFRPERTVEFMAFAGEEKGIFDGQVLGLAGSEQITRFYRRTGKEVAAYMNFDCIGSPFVQADCGNCSNPLGAKDNTIGVTGLDGAPGSTLINPNIRDLFVACVNAYAEKPYTALIGPGGASDHKSFSLHGYPVGFAVESNIGANGLEFDGFAKQRHHTDKDTIANVDFNYIKQFARATLGFIIEASFGPNSNAASVDFSANVECDSTSQFSSSASEVETSQPTDASLGTSQFSGSEFSSTSVLTSSISSSISVSYVILAIFIILSVL